MSNGLEKKKRVKRIFDDISPKYDLLNHLLSGGIDFYWRKKALKLAKVKHNSILLDVACGTGDFSISAKKLGINKIYGTDLSNNMLQFFRKKESSIHGKLTQAVAEYLPYKNSVFNLITVAFGIRNFYDIPKGLNEFNRTLQSGGKVLILEFRLPSNKLVRSFYLFYFNRILPAIGKIISKDNEAYQYLPDSVNEFEKNIDLVTLCKNSGFGRISKHSLTFGLVQIIIAEKV